jgi:predicted dithiol-disulfide oxidoreductase (DUF899 family)
MPTPEIVNRDAWLDARRALLEDEKALTRAKDAVNARRLTMPWVKVDKTYTFEGPDGPVTLAELFEHRSQLIVYHFMLAPNADGVCTGCAFLCDHVDGPRQHFEQHDVSFVAVARARFAELEAVRRRMGWQFRWVSSYASDFNYDFGVSYTPEQMAGAPAQYNFAPITPPIEDLSGVSVFYRDHDGQIFHTYSQYARGGEEVLGAYVWLDMTPLGRNETQRGNLTDWVRPHDSYGKPGHIRPTGQFIPDGCAACAAE